MSFEDCQRIHDVISTLLRKRFWPPIPETITQADIDDCLDLLGALDRAEKRALWRWLTEHDPNLKQWLKLQGDRRAAA